MEKKYAIMDGNEAAAYIAYKTNEVCAIYPITPSSVMGELADEWASKNEKNLWGDVPKVIEMQSEAGAAGTIHGALQGGTLATTFTASQGLLLMIPNMFKIAGELTPTVFHIAARAIATHALSIFGDHSDVMATRGTGFAMLFAEGVQEAMDMSLISQAATLQSRVPFMHIFDGFRTSHELLKIEVIPDNIIREMIDERLVNEHRKRSLNPNAPVIRGTAQNPDVFFQNREAGNLFYDHLPSIVEDTMNKFAKLTGRKYNLFDYTGDPQADRVIIMMGSGTGAVRDAMFNPTDKWEKVGLLTVRLYRPFDATRFIEALPSTVKTIAVLDRTKEPGSIGEPLYQDIVNALVEKRGLESFYKENGIRVIAGRYGLSSKEFTPAMAHAIFNEMKKELPKKHFTIGINDDVTHLSIDYDKNYYLHKQGDVYQAMFYGLGADGTVGANKNTIKIIGDTTDMFVQGYFVYDSKKSGSLTVSHLRFSNKPIHSSYLIETANFIACHNFSFIEKYNMLENASDNAIFLLNSPFGSAEIWDKLPRHMQRQIIDKHIRFYVVDARTIARDTGMGNRINSILQTCFFAISGLLPQQEAIKKIKDAIQKTYKRKGDEIIQKNFKAVDATMEHLHLVEHPDKPSHAEVSLSNIPAYAPEFVQEVLSKIMIGEGDDLPVSTMPAGGTFPVGTSKYEKRFIATEVPVWNEATCTQCAKCIIICPHAAIRAKIYDKSLLKDAPSSFKSYKPVGKEFDGVKEVYTLQVSVEDCTGCNLCIEICPVNKKNEEDAAKADSKTTKADALVMVDPMPLKDPEHHNWEFFLGLPELDRSRLNLSSVKGSQFLQPLFEFSGACSGCGETPYVKLVSQLMGDRMVVANATGCSSIYGGNLPTTPWTTNNAGRGPAWSNSLFEDNAEFGLGLRTALNFKKEAAEKLVDELQNEIGPLAKEVFEADQKSEQGIDAQRNRVHELKKILKTINSPSAKRLDVMAEYLVEQTVWIIGGDGWAYDIGFGGLDHVLASGENVNILVLDTEVYSNTGGQASKSTPLGASARFATSGKKTAKKDLALMAVNYGNVYVAQIAVGANDTQTVRAINEAAAYQGPSLILAYSPCIAHGFEISQGAGQQVNAVKSGYWPLFRYDPRNEQGKRFMLDSKPATMSLRDYLMSENRFSNVFRANPDVANTLFTEAEENAKRRWNHLEKLMEEL
jgi:pyruvate-ferredoxin/flavodoxin oxidoreductase